MFDVGIVIPVYNGRRGIVDSTWLVDSIESALHSDLENFIVTVVDDGSTDDTVEVVSKYLGARLQLVHTGENKGVAAALNIGIKHTDAKYIAIQGSDDICKPEKARMQADMLDALPNIQMVGCYYWMCRQDGTLIDEITDVSTDPADIRLDLISGNCKIGLAMFRKTLWEEISGFDEANFPRCCEDMDFFLRTVEQYPAGITIVPELLYGYRRSAQQLTDENYYGPYYAALELSRNRRREKKNDKRIGLHCANPA